jgi:hypothetical protein
MMSIGWGSFPVRKRYRILLFAYEIPAAIITFILRILLCVLELDYLKYF